MEASLRRARPGARPLRPRGTRHPDPKAGDRVSTPVHGRRAMDWWTRTPRHSASRAPALEDRPTPTRPSQTRPRPDAWSKPATEATADRSALDGSLPDSRSPRGPARSNAPRPGDPSRFKSRGEAGATLGVGRHRPTSPVRVKFHWLTDAVGEDCCSSTRCRSRPGGPLTNGVPVYRARQPPVEAVPCARRHRGVVWVLLVVHRTGSPNARAGEWAPRACAR